MYPTLDPRRTMRAMKTVSESKMTEGRKGAITNSWGNKPKNSIGAFDSSYVTLTLNEFLPGTTLFSCI